MLAVAEVSDSLGALPPNLIVYSVGQAVTRASAISGPCYSLGYSLVPFHFGFFASAPASAHRWGDPYPVIARIFPPAHQFVKLSQPHIPYGETLGASYTGNVVVACSPFSQRDCIITDLRNSTSTLRADDDILTFGLGVGVSPNGTVSAVLSRNTRDSIVQFFKKDGTLMGSAKVGVDIDLRDRRPVLHFRDERHLYVAVPSAQKLFMFKLTVNGWILMEYREHSFTAFASLGNRGFVTVTTDGRIVIMDKNFVARTEEIVPRSLNGGKFVEIAAGDDWFAVLEEASNRRRLHIYSMKGSRMIRGVLWFVGTCGVVMFVMFARGQVDGARLSRSKSKRDLEIKSV